MPYLIMVVLVYRILNVSSTSVWAGFDEGMQAYMRGDFATAVREWQPLAQQGDAKAQEKLAEAYYWGQGVPRDYGQAMQWWYRAAVQGNAQAQSQLGYMYEQGDARGFGIRQDYWQAMYWYRRAAEQGNDYAQHSLGLMYENGMGVPRDYLLAYFWFSLAAATKSGYAPNLGRVAPFLSPSQLADAQALARAWRLKSAGHCP